MNAFEIQQGNALEILRTLPKGFVQCCVTSPPYWSLRDYSVAAQVWGGDHEHQHIWGPQVLVSATNHTGKQRWNHALNGRREQPAIGNLCACGAWRGSLGLEPTPELYSRHLVEIFKEVRRVLRADGTLFLNLGDSYSSGNRDTYDQDSDNKGNRGAISTRPSQPAGIKPKDLLGIPWRVALALQRDGWYLRSDIIWAKSNPMPESVTDRPTRSHEYVFLLAKSERYYYDAEAIKEPIRPKTLTVRTTPRKGTGLESAGEKLNLWMERHGGRYHPPTRNKRSVWTIATQPYAGAHFATYPTALVEPCVKAGTSERGCCVECGAPWRRVVVRTIATPVDYNGKWSTADRQASGRRMLATFVLAVRQVSRMTTHFQRPRQLVGGRVAPTSMSLSPARCSTRFAAAARLEWWRSGSAAGFSESNSIQITWRWHAGASWPTLHFFTLVPNDRSK